MSTLAFAASGPPLRSPPLWVNGGPFDLSAFKGKVVFLWFYEEGCPTARAKWPALHALAEGYSDKPVAFIAVNSGNPPGAVNSYAQKNRLTWPIVVDMDRSFEQACEVGPISLSNIYQLRLIHPDGRITVGRWSDPGGSIERLLPEASWALDPKEVPLSLRPVWRKIELGDYASAAPDLKRASGSRTDEVRAGAKKLTEVVEKKIEEQLSAAEAQKKEGNTWNAYLLYEGIARQFKGYPKAADADNQRKKLASSPEMKKELAAQRALSKARKLLVSEKPAVRDRATASVKKMIADHPGTQAAKDAQALLDGATTTAATKLAKP